MRALLVVVVAALSLGFGGLACGRSPLDRGSSPSRGVQPRSPGTSPEVPPASDDAAPRGRTPQVRDVPAAMNDRDERDAGAARPRDTPEPDHEAPLPPFRTLADCIPGFIRSSVESLSFDGRYFAFVDAGGNAVVLDRDSGERQAATLPSDESLDVVAISGDGTQVAFKGLPGNRGSLFVWSRQQDASWARFFLGDATQGALSHDARYLAFSSRDPEIAEPAPYAQGGVIVADLETGEAWTAAVGPDGAAANDYSTAADLSDDGRLAIFASTATNLVAGKPRRRWDVYLHDHQIARTTLVARSLTGGYPDSHVLRPRISGDGTTVAFDSAASDLVPGDAPDTADLFVRELASGDIESPTVGRTWAATLQLANISRDGRSVLFATDGDGLVDEDDNGRLDVFVHDRARDSVELISRDTSGAVLEAESRAVAFSGDGRVAAFATAAAALAGTEREVTCFAERGR